MIADELQYDTLQNLCQRFQDSDNLKTQYLQLLSGLSQSPDVSTIDFLSRVEQIGQMGLIYVCYNKTGLLGTATLIYEPKIIRGLGTVGHIEDVVVCKNNRGQGIASALLQHLIQVAKPHCLQGHFGLQ